MYALGRVQRPGDEAAALLENSSLGKLVAAGQLLRRPGGPGLREEKMKRLLQGPASELSVTQGHRQRLFPAEAEAEVFLCGIQGKAAAAHTPFSVGRESSAGLRPASDREMNSVELGWEGLVPGSGEPGQKNPGGHGRGSAPDGQNATALSLHPGWRGAADEGGGLSTPSKHPARTSCPPGSRDRSSDVIGYIVEELQGISRIQTEIAELQQHLALIRGSVDEVSSCVDTVLSEIEGLQGPRGLPGKASRGRRTKAPAKEPVLYFYGIPEQGGEDTRELVCGLLSKYHCLNGQLCAGITVAASGDQPTLKCPEGVGAQLDPSSSSHQKQHNRGELSLGGDVIRTEGDGQFQADSCPVPEGRAVQGTGVSPPCLTPPSLAKSSNLIAELEETVGRIVQIISGSEQTLRPSSSPPACAPDAFPGPEGSTEPEDPDRGSPWPSPEERLALAGRASGPGAEAEAASKESPSPLEGDPAGGQTPGGSETDCDVTTLELLSPEPVSFAEEAPVAEAFSSDDGAVHKLVGSGEALKDMVQIDLNEQDPANQIFRDVLENSQYFLEHSRDSADLVDMRFYTNKLGKALNHFRSALQVVFHKLETGDPDALLEGDKSCHGGPEPAPTLWSASVHSGLENVLESPPSQSSESQVMVAVGSESPGSVQGALPVVPLPLEEAPDSGLGDVLDSESSAGQPLSLDEGQQVPSSNPEQTNGGRPMSLEKVCAETIYLNKCINNFKNVLREKRQMRRKLLKEVAQEASWTSSAEELHSGTWQGWRRSLMDPAGEQRHRSP
uniref:Uncharacterized protein n=1 Tax=Sphaerodactylus townsendi TaxID=933632 RepID=A0ACB8EPQ1_9SAUR